MSFSKNMVCIQTMFLHAHTYEHARASTGLASSDELHLRCTIDMEVAGVDSQAPKHVEQLANGEAGCRTLAVQMHHGCSCSHGDLSYPSLHNAPASSSISVSSYMMSQAPRAQLSTA
jgi:hypothetical protein